MHFENITHPGELPVDGDRITYTIHGREFSDIWSYNVFELLLNIAEDERLEGLTQLAFRRLFTFDELVAIDNAEHSDSFTSLQKATLCTFTKTYQAASTIHLSSDDTKAGIGMLVSYGLLTRDRADALLMGKAPV